MDLKILKNLPPWEWPEEAGELILGILRDDRADKADRLIAAELAGDYTVINDELAEVLLSILRSGIEPESLRARAVISLGPALEHTDTLDFDDDEDDLVISLDKFHEIQKALRKLYFDAGVPKDVRRRILEASVRAQQDWHKDAIRAAYASDDEAWKLTAVFGMRFIRGFEDQILEALESRNPDILYEAVCAAGGWELKSAWPHVARLARPDQTDKALLLAAIEAVAFIRPQEAAGILDDLLDSEDEEVTDAVYEALGMAEGLAEEEEFDDDDDDEFLH